MSSPNGRARHQGTRNRVKPWVSRLCEGLWAAIVTRGYSGNYEHEYIYGDTWREAYDQAYNCVKGWRP